MSSNNSISVAATPSHRNSRTDKALCHSSLAPETGLPVTWPRTPPPSASAATRYSGQRVREMEAESARKWATVVLWKWNGPSQVGALGTVIMLQPSLPPQPGCTCSADRRGVMPCLDTKGRARNVCIHFYNFVLFHFHLDDFLKQIFCVPDGIFIDAHSFLWIFMAFIS